MDAIVLLLALVLRLFIAWGVGYLAAELGHDPFIWGIIALIIGLWAVLALLVWHALTGN